MRIKVLNFSMIMGNEVLLNEVNYIFFIILFKFVIYTRDVTLVL